MTPNKEGTVVEVYFVYEHSFFTQMPKVINSLIEIQIKQT